MAVGQLSSYDLTVGRKVLIDEAIYMLSPMDSPLLSGFDADGMSVLPKLPVSEVEHTWQTEEILTPRSRLAGALTTGTTFITVQSGDRVKFSTGDSLHLREAAGGSETVRVTGYGSTAETLTVTRALISGTAGDVASGVTVIGVGTALPEGSDPESHRSVDRVTAVNCTQIFGPHIIDLTGTDRVISRYGVPDQWAHELVKLNAQITIAREQALLYGQYYNSSTTEIRTHGGIDYYNTVNVDSTATQLTITGIEALQVDQYDLGGLSDLLIANPKSLSDLNEIADEGRVRTTIGDTMRGRAPVTHVDTEFGRVHVARNRWCTYLDAFLISREQAVVRTLRPNVFEPLAKTGDSDSAQVVGEHSFTFKGAEHAAKFTNLTAYAPA